MLFKSIWWHGMNKAEKFWDGSANKFDKRAERFEENMVKTIKNARKHLKDSDRVLDYGCATGTITYEIADNVKEILGIDLSSKMIDIAKSKADQSKNEKIDFTQATIFDQRLSEKYFDAILASDIIHLVEDVQKVVQRLNELLKPGGLLISSTPCLGEKKTFKGHFLFFLIFTLSKVGIVPSISFFKIPDLEHLITSENFKIIETESLSHSPEEYFIVAKKIA